MAGTSAHRRCTTDRQHEARTDDGSASTGFVRVVLPLPVSKVFDYRLPAESTRRPFLGSRVMVPFGRRRLLGWVVGCAAQPEIPESQVKAVVSYLDEGGPVFPRHLLRFTHWLAQDCGASWGQVLHTATPPVLRRFVRLTLPVNAADQDEGDTAPMVMEPTPRRLLSQIQLEGHYGLSDEWRGWIERVRETEQSGSILIVAPDHAVARLAADQLRRAGCAHVRVVTDPPHNKNGLADWQEARTKTHGVWVGLRSIVFWPVNDLRLMVLIGRDEPGHRQDQPPHHHTSRAVFLRAAVSSCAVIWCDALPAPEVWLRRRTLPQTTTIHFVPHRTRPHIRLIDRRGFKTRGGGFTLPPLLSQLQRWVDQDKRMVLIHNRVGFSTHIVCLGCKKSWCCPRCDRRLIQRYRRKVLMCPSCGGTQPLPQECPECGSKTVRFLGRGTERLESEWARWFPASRTAVVEAGAPWPGEACRVLFTTQAGCDRWDWPGFDVAVFLNPDTELYRPHVDTSWRLFKRLLKTARRTREEVILVSALPDHPVFEALCRWDVAGFLDGELQQREELGLPPHRRLFGVLVKAVKEETGLKAAGRIYDSLRHAVDGSVAPVEVLDPIADHQPKLRDRYRFLVPVAADPEFPLGVWLRDRQHQWPRPKDTRIVLLPDP